MRCCKRYNYFQTKHRMDTTRPIPESGRQHLATGSTYLQRNCCMNPIKHEANTVQQSPAAISTASLPTMGTLQNHDEVVNFIYLKMALIRLETAL